MTSTPAIVYWASAYAQNCNNKCVKTLVALKTNHVYLLMGPLQCVYKCRPLSEQIKYLVVNRTNDISKRIVVKTIGWLVVLGFNAILTAIVI